jgi:hypothetical protein
MMRSGLVAVSALVLIACGAGGPGSDVRSGSAHLAIDSPKPGQVITVRSVSVGVHADGADQLRLHYYLDGADEGPGDTSITIPNLPPGSHRLEVEGLHGDGSAYSPPLRAGVDFIIQ